MKKTLILPLALALLSVSASSFAQTAGPKTGTPPVSAPVKGHAHTGKKLKKMHEAMLAKLNLSPALMAKIEAHDKEMATERKVIAKSEKGTKGEGKSEATKEKLKALKKQNKEFYKENLTKDQLKEMKAMRKAARQSAQAKGTTTKPLSG